ncbi:MAG: nucleotidyltransferase domain-containing protein [Spirochaetota bacterium]|nr:nucleotidyltransferase domain-containing protein [Spirochaetota bacterium]
MYKQLILTNNERKAIASFKDVIDKKYNLIDIEIFGSKARGDYTKESDIDIMIILHELNPTIEAEIDDIIFNINLKYDVLICIVIFTKKELEDGPMDESPLFRTIRREGVMV